MKRKISIYTSLIFTLLFAFCSCSEKQDINPPHKGASLILKSSTTAIKPYFDDNKKDFQNGDQIGVFIKDKNTEKQESTNLLCTYKEGTWESAEEVLTPSGIKQITAYYPYSDKYNGTKIEVQLPLDQSDLEKINKADLLVCNELIDHNSKEVNIHMKHALPLLVVNITDPADAVSSVSFGVKTEATIDLTGSSASTNGEVKEVKPYKLSTDNANVKSFACIIVPQVLNDKLINIRLKDGKILTEKLKDKAEPNSVISQNFIVEPSTTKDEGNIDVSHDNGGSINNEQPKDEINTPDNNNGAGENSDNGKVEQPQEDKPKDEVNTSDNNSGTGESSDNGKAEQPQKDKPKDEISTPDNNSGAGESSDNGKVEQPQKDKPKDEINNPDNNNSTGENADNGKAEQPKEDKPKEENPKDEVKKPVEQAPDYTIKFGGINVSDWTNNVNVAGGIIEKTQIRDWKKGDYITYLKSKNEHPVTVCVFAEGFTQDQLNEYEKAAKDGLNYMFNVEPFKTYKDMFNVYIVMTPSKEEGMSLDGSPRKDTYFGFIFPSAKNMESPIVKSRTNAALRELCPDIKEGKTTLDKASVFIIINVDDYVGITYQTNSGLGIGMTAYRKGRMSWSDAEGKNGYEGDWRNVFLHENGGHVIGRLADEYTAGNERYSGREILDHTDSSIEPRSLNITEDPTNKLFWKDFIGKSGYEKVGIFEGGYYYKYGIWRSEFSNCMIDNRPYFSAWCRYLIAKRIHKIAQKPFTMDDFFRQDVLAKAPIGVLKRSATIETRSSSDNSPCEIIKLRGNCCPQKH